MNDSLSIIFPVRNAESSLASQVHELLDLLPDLTGRFEILVVDDGSTDQTAEIATELARKYPQLRIIRSNESQGHEAAVKLGVARALGQTLLIHEGNGRLSPTDLRRLWSLRHDRGLVMAHAQQPGLLSPDLVERLCTWGQTLRSLARYKQKAGIQMIRRDAAESLVSVKAPNNKHQAPNKSQSSMTE